MKKDEIRPKVTHIEARQQQALPVTSSIRKLIKSKQLVRLYNIKEWFST